MKVGELKKLLEGNEYEDEMEIKLNEYFMNYSGCAYYLDEREVPLKEINLKDHKGIPYIVLEY